MNWEQISRDFSQKYKHTFVHVILENENHPDLYYINDVRERLDEPPEIVLSNPGVGRIILRYDSNSQIIFSYPESGYFFFRNTAILFFHRMNRQWSRGLSSRTAVINNPYAQWCSSLNYKLERFDLLKAAFAAVNQPSLRDAQDILKEENVISIPLTKEIALGQDVQASGKYLLWWYDNPIGRVKDDIIFLEEELFYQEVRDYLWRYGQNDISIRCN